MICGVNYLIFAMEDIEQILTVAKEISDNTDAWADWVSVAMTIISLVASIVTIAGIVMFYIEYQKNKISRSCQKKVILDLVRHFFVNNVILELIRENFAEGKRPIDGVFLRFSTLASDENLCKLSNNDKGFDEIHQLCLLLRNYNIAVGCAEKHFSESSCSDVERLNDIDEIYVRSVKITDKLIVLAQTLKLGINNDLVKEHLFSFVSQELCIPVVDLQKRQISSELLDNKIAGFYNKFGCLGLFVELKENRRKTLVFI